MPRLALAILGPALFLLIVPSAVGAPPRIPRTADELIVVSSPTADPPAPGYLATLRAYERRNAHSRWRLEFGPWRAETGSGHLVRVRRFGDHATPIGVFGIGSTVYGVNRDPGRLHDRYRRLVCGDWWDEDPYSSAYNRLVHVRCGATPAFAAWSEALWTERIAYAYLAVVRFNMRPVVGGADAPGAGIFLHNWVGGATQGCIALHQAALLRLLRWLRPAEDPVIEIRIARGR